MFKQIILYLVIWLCSFNGIVKVTTDLPTTQGCGEILVDPITLQPVPLTDLGWILHTAYKCNGDSIRFSDIDVRGMEGDSLGIDYEFFGGTVGRIIYRSKDTSGNISCEKWEYTFAVEMDSIILPPPPPPGDGIGIMGRYFRDLNRSIFVGSRRDDTVNFKWGTGSPGLVVNGDFSYLMPSDSFSVEWNGEIYIPETGTWTFCRESEDGAAGYINWTYQFGSYGTLGLSERCVTASLNQGWHELHIDYMARLGNAECTLTYSGPGVPKQIIPRSALR